MTLDPGQIKAQANAERRSDPLAREFMDEIRNDGIRGMFSLPATAEFAGCTVIVDGDDEDAWRTERVRDIYVDDKGDAVGVVPHETKPWWDTVPVSRLWLIELAVDRFVELRDDRIIRSLQDTISPN